MAKKEFEFQINIIDNVVYELNAIIKILTY